MSRDLLGGTKEHGTVTVGLTAVLAQAAHGRLNSWMGQVASGGNVFTGTSSVTTANSVKLAVGDTIVLNASGDDTWMVSDQAGTVVVFLRELAP